MKFGVLPLERCRDEERVRLGVFMLSNLNADLWDSNANLIQEPQQSVVIYCIWREKKRFYLQLDSMVLVIFIYSCIFSNVNIFLVYFSSLTRLLPCLPKAGNNEFTAA